RLKIQSNASSCAWRTHGERGVSKSRGAGRADTKNDPLTSTTRTTAAAVKATRARGERSGAPACPPADTSTRERKIPRAGRELHPQPPRPKCSDGETRNG